MYIREMIFGQESYLPRHRRHGNWILVLSIAILAAIAWRYGILASGFHSMEAVAAALWRMLTELTDSIRDFLQYLIAHRP